MATRYLAVDLHKHYVVVGGVDAQRDVVLPPRRVGLTRWAEWRARHLRATDEVVIESTTNAWHQYDLLVQEVQRVVVAHPAKLRHLRSRKVKTDAGDVLDLATLLQANLLPEVWVPPPHVRQLRVLIAHRRRLVQRRTQARNRLHSLLHRYDLAPSIAHPFNQKHATWWTETVAPRVSAPERLALRHDWHLQTLLAAQIAEVEAELHRLSTCQPWVTQLPFLLQLPGIGVVAAMTLLATIGDVARFPSAKQLASYAGLTPRVHISGQTHRTGAITKEGRRDLRWAMTEAAHSAVRYHPFWQAQYRNLAKRIGSKKAIVAIARRLLVVVWHVLSKRELDRQAIPKKVITSLMQWGWKLTPEQRQGLETSAWIRWGLLQLGLAVERTSITYGGMTRRIAPPDAVTALELTFPNAA